MYPVAPRCPQCGLWPRQLPGKMGPGSYSPHEPNMCVLFRCYGFCPYGLDCDYQHPEEYRVFLGTGCDPNAVAMQGSSTSTTTLASVHENLITLMRQQLAEQNGKGMHRCLICREVTMESPACPVATSPVGETHAAKLCIACGNFYFQPMVQHLVVSLLESVGTDYAAYKARIDELCSEKSGLPPEYRVPVKYEAHRWGTSRFGWSLFGPRNVQDVLKYIFNVMRQRPQNSESTFEPKQKLHRILSMGAGRGYTEHLFAAALAAHKSFGISEVLAYDTQVNVPRQIRFNVPVKYGTPETLRDFGSLKDTVLLLVWPPFGSKVNEESRMGYDTLVNFAVRDGRVLIYVGDPSATGDWRFHELLMSSWIREEAFRSDVPVWVPQEMGLLFAGSDQVAIYTRRAQPLDLPPVQWVVER
eukprot:PhM_4_TR17483/c0_g1_i3/m.96804